jgi:large subunit ribosomal protein L13
MADMSTTLINVQTATPQWLVIDATDQVVGRLAVQVANLLRGKHKPTYTPNADTGDFVIVINAEKVQFTGKKWDQKFYKHFTHYAGGLRHTSAKDMLESKPTEILRLAVKRMMPRGPQAYKQLTKLKIYVGPNHEHQAQQPVALDMKTKS